MKAELGEPATGPCASCATPFEGDFCPRCGERRLDAERFSLRHFLTEGVEAVASLDGRLWRTLATLLTAPGRLTSEYFAGRRTLYLRPLQLFLICNVFFALAQSLVSSRTFNTPLQVHAHASRHRELAHRWVFGGPHVDREILTPSQERFRERFDAAVENQSKTLVILMVPLLASFLALLFIRQRRYFVEHLVFASHFYSFLMLATPVLVFAMVTTLRALARRGVDISWLNDEFLSYGIMLAWAAYLGVAVRRYYVRGRWAGAWRGILIAVITMEVIFIYRLILFFTAYYSARRA